MIFSINGIKLKNLLATSIYNVVDIKKITPVVIHHRWFILGVSCTMMSLTTLVAITNKPTYQSSMQILVSYNLDESLSGNKIESENTKPVNRLHSSSINYSSQIKLMLSDKLLQKAVNLLHTDYPQITIEDIAGDSQTRGKSALNIAELPVDSENKKNFRQLFLLTFTDKDSLRTKRVLQALQKVYQDYNSEQKNQRVNQGLAFVNNRIPKLQKDVLKAEKKLEKFGKDNNLIDPIVQSKILLQSLADIQQQRQKIRAELQDIQARHNNLERAIASTNPDESLLKNTSNSRQYQALINELNQTERELNQGRIFYTEKHPAIQKLQQKKQIILKILEQQRPNKAININDEIRSSLAINSKLERDLTQLKMTALGLIANDSQLAKSEQQIRDEISKYPSLITKYKSLVSDVEIYRKTLEQLMQVQHSLGIKIAQEGFNWQILEEPALGIYIGNLRWLLIIGGVLSGPILGLLAALIWEKFQHKIFYAQDLQTLTNIQLLGSVPKLGKGKNSWQSKLKNLLRYKAQNTESSLAKTIKELPNHQTLDIIYRNIQLLNSSWPLKSLMLTSALPGEGKTTLALGLGASAARMHQRVLIIDANLRSPNLHQTLGLTNDWGLSLLLVDDENTSFHNYIQPIHPAIDVLTAGPIPDDAVNLLSSERMEELMDLFTQSYDLVLIDAPSVLDTVDGRIMASLCNGIVMVGRIGKVTPDKLIEATEILSKLNLIGIVGNEVYDFPQILTP
jgi:capsular exopolysaccharide synthesis family protein